MKKQIFFLQGAGEGAHEADEKLVVSLRRLLGSHYDVHYPVMPNEDDVEYEVWKQYIDKKLDTLQSPVLIIGHSIGGSILLKYLSEVKPKKQIVGIFLLATPFWGGDGWLYEGYEKLALPGDFASKLPKNVPVFLYHGTNDEIVPLSHIILYSQILPNATTRKLNGSHQLNNDLSEVAEDIKSLS